MVYLYFLFNFLPVNIFSAGVVYQSETGYISDQLYKAVIDDDIEEVVKRINNGEDINARGYDGKTLLIHAVEILDDLEDMIYCLLDLGINEILQDIYGYSALHRASSFSDNPGIIRLLLEAGSNVESLNCDDYTPLMCAASDNSNPEIIRELISAGADINARGYYGGTALMSAAFRNNSKIIEILISQ